MNPNDRFAYSLSGLSHTCLTCGALVEDREAHNDWHNELERTLERLATFCNEDAE